MSEFHGSGSFTLSRASLGASWHHKKSNLYKETLLKVTDSLKINADDFNAAADAVVEQHLAEVTYLHAHPGFKNFATSSAGHIHMCAGYRNKRMFSLQQTLEAPTAVSLCGKQT